MSPGINVGSSKNLLIISAALIIGGLCLISIDVQLISLGGWIFVLGIINLVLAIFGLFKEFSSRPKDPGIEKKFKKEFNKGINLMKKELYREALQNWNVLLRNPHLTLRGINSIKKQRAICYLQLDDSTTAYSEIMNVMQNSRPEADAETYSIKYLIEMKMNRINQAKQTFSKAMMMYPNHPVLDKIRKQTSS